MGMPTKSGYYGYEDEIVYVSIHEDEPIEEATVYVHGDDFMGTLRYYDSALFGDRLEVNGGKVTVVTEE